MARFTRLPAALMIAGLLLTSCFSAGQSPTEVVKAFYAAANDGRYADGEKLLSAKTLKEIVDGLGSREKGLKFMLDGETKDRTMDRVDFLNEQIDGDRATVNVKIVFLKGEAKESKQMLVNEGGQWKVTFLPAG